MRPYFTIILCASLLLQSCTSTSGISKDEGLNILRQGTEDCEVMLNTGVILKLEGGRYTVVSEPADFYFGAGTSINYRTGKERPFAGRYVPVKTFSDTTEGSDGMLVCWRDDTSAVRFRRGEYGRVTPESGVGLYILGMSEAVPLENIDLVSIEKFDAGKTVFTGVGAFYMVGASLCLSLFLFLYLPSQ